MTLPHVRAANRERKAAKILGTKRVVRKDMSCAPDNESFVLENGDVVQPEVKNGMKRCPRGLINALKQARRYSPKAVPLAVFSDVGGEDIACVPLRDLARWIGVAPEKMGVQLALPLYGTLRPRRQIRVSSSIDERQLNLPFTLKDTRPSGV